VDLKGYGMKPITAEVGESSREVPVLMISGSRDIQCPPDAVCNTFEVRRRRRSDNRLTISSKDLLSDIHNSMTEAKFIDCVKASPYIPLPLLSPPPAAHECVVGRHAPFTRPCKAPKRTSSISVITVSL